MKRQQRIYPFIFIIISSSFLIFSACRTIKDELIVAERNNTLPQTIWQAFSKLDSDPSNEEVRQLVKEYGYKTISYLLFKGKNYLYQDEYTLLMDCFYTSNNSATRIIEAYKRFGFYHPEQNTPDSMRAIIEQRLDDYYQSCIDKFKAFDFISAVNCFKKIKGLKDVDSYIAKSDKEIEYQEALNQFSQGNFRKAYELFSKMNESFKDVYTKKKECIEKGRVLVAFSGFSDAHQQQVITRFKEKINNDLFIKLINIEDIVSYSSTPAKYIYIVKGSLDITKSDYLDPYTEQSGIRAWSVESDKKVIRTFKSKQSNNCTIFVYKAKETYYSIRRVLINIEVKANFDVVDARNSSVYYSDKLNSYFKEDFKYNYYNGPYKVSTLSLRNALLDTITVCDNINKYTYNYSIKDRDFQELFTKKKDIGSPDALVKKAVSELAIKVADAIYSKISIRD